MRDRRYRLIYLSEQDIISMLNTPSGNQIVEKLECTSLPDGYIADGVVYCVSRQCFAIRIYNAAFEPLLLGQEIPEIPLMLKRRTFKTSKCLVEVV